MRLEPGSLVLSMMLLVCWCRAARLAGGWLLTNADHVVALVVCLGLLFRRTVQRRHFGLPTDNDGGAGREYLWGWVVALFDGACLLVGGSAIVARGTITVVRV